MFIILFINEYTFFIHINCLDYSFFKSIYSLLEYRSLTGLVLDDTCPTWNTLGEYDTCVSALLESSRTLHYVKSEGMGSGLE